MKMLLLPDRGGLRVVTTAGAPSTCDGATDSKQKPALSSYGCWDGGGFGLLWDN
jgi:hypothetical protein